MVMERLNSKTDGLVNQPKSVSDKGVNLLVAQKRRGYGIIPPYAAYISAHIRSKL